MPWEMWRYARRLGGVAREEFDVEFLHIDRTFFRLAACFGPAMQFGKHVGGGACVAAFGTQRCPPAN